MSRDIAREMLGRVEEILDVTRVHKRLPVVDKPHDIGGGTRVRTDNATAVYYGKHKRIIMIVDNDSWDEAVVCFRKLREEMGFAKEDDK